MVTVLQDITALQQQFVPCNGIYLLSHSVGRLPVTTRAHVEAGFFKAWESGTPDPWFLWLDAIAGFKNALARLLNGEANAFCPQVNVSSALTKILYAQPAKAGKDVIVMTENDFPSMGFVLQQAERQGYRLKMIPAQEDTQQLDTWDEALKEDVHSVLITHVHFNSSRLNPVGEITRLARQRRIISIVDIAQSCGVVPIDLRKWNADFVLGSCVKWLCGGPGAGFLWVDPDLTGKLEPIDVGWFSHKTPFEFDIHHFQYAADASRFWGGTPSVLPYVVAAHGIDLINSIGVEVIREHNRRLTEKIIKNIDPQSLRTPKDPQRRGGTLVLSFKQQQRVEQALEQAGVVFDSRPAGLRLSPHIYNSEQEIDAVVKCLITSDAG